MQHTPDTQVAAMRELCDALKGDVVKEAIVDDWGRFGNFQLKLIPHRHEKHTTNAIKALVRRNMPRNAHLRACFPPDPVRKRDWDGVLKVVGHSRKYWMLDIDFQRYDPITNSFAAAN